MEFTIEHRDGLASLVHLTMQPDEPVLELTDALAMASNVGEDTVIWLHGSNPERAEVMAATGRTTNRTLLQMRVPLPAAAPGIETSAFTSTDLDEFIAVNNRAFDWHPEQSGLTHEQVANDMAQDWYRDEAFRLHRVDGALAGFCWTKIHPATADDPPLGEIYTIAVDAPFQGRGLGKAMTLAGLDWLHNQGLEVGMLYVESDNEAAVATYERIGFSVAREDTLWRPKQ